MAQPDSLTSGITSKTFTSFGADIDLTTAVPTNGSAQRTACRRIRVNAGSSLNLTLKYPDGSQDTWTGLSQGDMIDVQAVAILASGTTVTSVTVQW